MAHNDGPIHKYGPIIMLIFSSSRCLWFVWFSTHRVIARESSMRPRGVWPFSIPEPTDSIRQAPSSTALSPLRQRSGHWAALLRAPGGQDADWNTDQRHAPERRVIQLALHAHPMTVYGELKSHSRIPGWKSYDSAAVNIWIFSFYLQWTFPTCIYKLNASRKRVVFNLLVHRYINIVLYHVLNAIIMFFF